MSWKDVPLVSLKRFSEFTPALWLKHVKDMYELRVKSGSAAAAATAKPSFAAGLTLRRTKTGKISILLNPRKRTFAYVLEPEIAALSTGYGMTQAEVWNAFKKKGFIIARVRMEAEHIYGTQRSTQQQPPKETK